MSDFCLATLSSRTSLARAGKGPVAAESPGRAESTPKRRTPEPSRETQRDHDAVAGGDDRGEVSLVLGDEPIVLHDGLRGRTLPLDRSPLPIVRELLGAGDAAGPQDVVADVQ